MAIMLNCTHGTIDDSNFSRPMPYIGLYIAGATLLSAILMFIDLVKGFKSRKFWIPCNYFPINAATLTFIAVAVKLSVDLNSSMPTKEEQVAKLATSAYICIVFANNLPSLAKLEKGELQANTVALTLLIITSIVNLCIQLSTGAILAFRKAHIFMIVMMLLNLKMCVFTAGELGEIKIHFQLKFQKLHRQIVEESFCNNKMSENVSSKMEDYLKKFSMMAQSGCPHFLLSRSLTSLATLVCSLVPASALVFVVVATVTHKNKMVGLNTCSGESDYGWSIKLILIAQAFAIVMGLAAPLCRTIYHIKASWLEVGQSLCERLLLSIPILFLAFCLTLVPMWFLMWEDVHNNSNHPNQESNSLRPYFLHWKRERKHIDFMVESCSRLTQKYLDTVKAEELKHLVELLDRHLSPDFRGVLMVEKYQVPQITSSCSDRLTNSWALTVLTLTCVATALPLIDQSSKKWLKKSVFEGLEYVMLVEKNLNGMHSSYASVAAAEHIVQDELDECSWLSVDLEELAQKHSGPKDVLSSLADTAKKHFSEIVREGDNFDFENPGTSSRKAVAAHSMHKICQTILLECQNENNLDPSSDYIFKKLRSTIADTLGACLTNLKQYILQECKRSNIEKRKETAFRMLKIFRKTEGIFEILERENMRIPPLSDEKMASMDGWCLYLADSQT